MLLDWTTTYNTWLDRTEELATAGDAVARTVWKLVNMQLQYLEELPDVPTSDTAMLMHVAQSPRRNKVWRAAHPAMPGFQVRTVVWFPERTDLIVPLLTDIVELPVAVPLFTNDKEGMGNDAFYGSVTRRADTAISQWLRERKEDAR